MDDITYPLETAMPSLAAFDTGSFRGGFSFRETGPETGAKSRLQGVSATVLAIATGLQLEGEGVMRATDSSIVERASESRSIAALFSFCSRLMAFLVSACKTNQCPGTTSDEKAEAASNRKKEKKARASQEQKETRQSF